MSKNSIVSEIQENGIVGAGGAGFPTHIKVAAEASTIIVNAAECEPLIHKDKEILLHHTTDFLAGLKMVMEASSAPEGIIGIKGKHTHIIDHLNKHVGDGVRVVPIGDFYPAGDEITLIYETTGKVVEAGKIPITQGVIVSNVETLLNVGRRRPVTTTFITLGGDVENKITLEVPIGIPIRTLIDYAKPTISDYAVLLGGPMMGRLTTDLDELTSKTSSAINILPADHTLVQKMLTMGKPATVRKIGKSACDQCVFCTALCPRYLLGHPIQPHKSMRTLMFSSVGESVPEMHAMACCECNLCTLISCPEGLYPGSISSLSKRFAASTGMRFDSDEFQSAGPHPLIKYRRTPTSKLKRVLDLNRFGDSGPLTSFAFTPKTLSVPLRQHIGKVAESIVSVGDSVYAGQKIATVGTDLGSEIHAPMAGKILRVSESIIDVEVG
ncbi:MAG: Na+-translocating ferredoxin:NAD+ oxidoreductase RnfC subunit [Desulforhopalus sp.]|jgi:Na+-translocating ferredoxin:NAD+ oxidoreductase RnfC subunit